MVIHLIMVSEYSQLPIRTTTGTVFVLQWVLSSDSGRNIIFIISMPYRIRKGHTSWCAIGFDTSKGTLSW